MKVAITGVTGTIGRMLTFQLEKEGISWLGFSRGDSVDNYIHTDYSYESLKQNLVNVDAVVHLAAIRGRVTDYASVSENASITENILKVMKENRILKFIFISSNAVYGDVEKLPWKEDQMIEPRTFYGLSKAVCESLVRLYCDSTIEYIIYRCAPVISMNNKGFMISSFLNSAQNGETLHVDHSIAKRSFIYERDVVRAIIWALRQSGKSGIFNLAMEKAYTNLEIAQCINEVTGNSNNLIHHIDKCEGTVSAYMDISKLKQYGFDVNYTMKDAVTQICSERSGIDV